MTPTERIDAALNAVLRASGSALKHYTMPGTLEAMRKAMRDVMVSEYMAGAADTHEAATAKGQEDLK